MDTSGPAPVIAQEHRRWHAGGWNRLGRRYRLRVIALQLAMQATHVPFQGGDVLRLGQTLFQFRQCGRYVLPGNGRKRPCIGAQRSLAGRKWRKYLRRFFPRALDQQQLAELETRDREVRCLLDRGTDGDDAYLLRP